MDSFNNYVTFKNFYDSSLSEKKVVYTNRLNVNERSLQYKYQSIFDEYFINEKIKKSFKQNTELYEITKESYDSETLKKLFAKKYYQNDFKTQYLLKISGIFILGKTKKEKKDFIKTLVDNLEDIHNNYSTKQYFYVKEFLGRKIGLKSDKITPEKNNNYRNFSQNNNVYNLIKKTFDKTFNSENLILDPSNNNSPHQHRNTFYKIFKNHYFKENFGWSEENIYRLIATNEFMQEKDNELTFEDFINDNNVKLDELFHNFTVKDYGNFEIIEKMFFETPLFHYNVKNNVNNTLIGTLTRKDFEKIHQTKKQVKIDDKLTTNPFNNMFKKPTKTNYSKTVEDFVNKVKNIDDISEEFVDDNTFIKNIAILDNNIKNKIIESFTDLKSCYRVSVLNNVFISYYNSFVNENKEKSLFKIKNDIVLKLQELLDNNEINAIEAQNIIISLSSTNYVFKDLTSHKEKALKIVDEFLHNDKTCKNFVETITSIIFEYNDELATVAEWEKQLNDNKEEIIDYLNMPEFLMLFLISGKRKMQRNVNQYLKDYRNTYYQIYKNMIRTV